MADLSRITDQIDVIAAVGVDAGIFDHVDGDRIMLTKADGGLRKGRHDCMSGALVAGVEGDKVRRSANADVAATCKEQA